MNKEELKELLIEARLQVVEATVEPGHCPYDYYPLDDSIYDIHSICKLYHSDCRDCRDQFLLDAEHSIREAVNAL